MDAPLESVTAFIFCRSGGGSFVASSVHLIVVFFESFVLGVMRRSVCRGSAS